MNFHEIRFPAAISFGSSGGIERRTEIVTLVNGFEERNSPWSQSRRRYDAGIGVRSLDDLSEILRFFEARHGQLPAWFQPRGVGVEGAQLVHGAGFSPLRLRRRRNPRAARGLRCCRACCRALEVTR